MLSKVSTKDSILIGLTGDVMIGRLVDEKLNQVDYAYVWGDVRPYLCSTDINVINLEAALTTSENSVPKVFNFKCKPDRVELLKLAQVKVANLANNHSLDYDKEGLLETLQVLRAAHIQPVGAGANSGQAQAPVVLDVKGIKVGVLGFTDNEPSWQATAENPGVNTIEIDKLGLKHVEESVVALRGKVDIIILTIHWGPNMVERPPQHFQQFARRVIDLGVDIFHGHSAHLFQGVEIYRRGVIFYDTGDFVDDYYVDPRLRNDLSFLFIVEASKKGIEAIKLIPTCIDRFQVNLAQGNDKDFAMQRMQMLSSELGTQFEVVKEGLAKQIAEIYTEEPQKL